MFNFGKIGVGFLVIVIVFDNILYCCRLFNWCKFGLLILSCLNIFLGVCVKNGCNKIVVKWMFLIRCVIILLSILCWFLFFVRI